MHTVIVDQPLNATYAQWTSFERFPEFMDDVESVTQLDDTTLLWTVHSAGATREWRAAITEQRLDEVIAWESDDGSGHSGRVEFKGLDDNKTEVTLEMTFEPHSLTDRVATAVGYVDRHVKKSLEAFRDYAETRNGPVAGYEKRVRTGGQVRPIDARADRTDHLVDLTVPELYELAQSRNIKGRSNMRKAELVDALS